jgi:hypothetical protein
MVNREIAIIVAIAAILVSIPVTFFPLPQAQGASTGLSLPDLSGYTKSAIPKPGHETVNPAGVNTTSASNMTGAAGKTTGANMTGANTTVGAHGTSIPTAKPAGSASESSCGECIK